ncbi:hypothetical protein AB0J35_32625 [Nonomuraea angiospora]|uniref:hypothetical protein n=1 Tax=Nonomuraea angiospora TaxID=46172 RepID=UPI003427E4FD
MADEPVLLSLLVLLVPILAAPFANDVLIRFTTWHRTAAAQTGSVLAPGTPGTETGGRGGLRAAATTPDARAIALPADGSVRLETLNVGKKPSRSRGGR